MHELEALFEERIKQIQAKHIQDWKLHLSDEKMELKIGLND